jgi:hypothetical protein
MVVVVDWCWRVGAGADSEIVMLVVLINVKVEAMFGRDKGLYQTEWLTER